MVKAYMRRSPSSLYTLGAVWRALRTLTDFAKFSSMLILESICQWKVFCEAKYPNCYDTLDAFRGIKDDNLLFLCN